MKILDLLQKWLKPVKELEIDATEAPSLIVVSRRKGPVKRVVLRIKVLARRDSSGGWVPTQVGIVEAPDGSGRRFDDVTSNEAQARIVALWEA